MAFKMKGSAFKLGNVATKSTLKQTSPMKHDPNDDVQPGTQHKDWLAQADRHNKRHTAGETHDEHGDWDTKEEEPKKDEGTLQMKSPMKDKLTDWEHQKTVRHDKNQKHIPRYGEKSPNEMKSPMKGLEGAAHSGHNRTHHLEEVAPDLRKKEKSPNEMKSPMKDQKANTKSSDRQAHMGADHQHNWKGSTEEEVHPEDYPETEEAKVKRLNKKRRKQEIERAAQKAAGKPKMKSPAKHTGSASHPTGAIAAHKGHMSKKMTTKIKRDIVPKRYKK